MTTWYNIEMEKIVIDKIIPGGQGLGTLPDGKKIFFWNALPGEIITNYQITKQKSHFVEAIATDITNPSPHRVTPQDTCYLATSPWQIMDFSYENQLKVELVKEVFRQAGVDFNYVDLPDGEEASPENNSCISSNQEYFYRNKMEYSLFWDKDLQKIKLAFHERGTHRKIPITTSSLERPEIFQKASEIIEDLNSRGEEARKYQSILLRCNQAGVVSGGLYENHQPHPNFPTLSDQILGQSYTYSPNGFFQINLPVYEMTLQEIKKHINTAKVLDLYSGVGTIGLSVARDKELVLVENNKSAFRELSNNAFGGHPQSRRSPLGTRERSEGRSEEPRNDGRDERPPKVIFDNSENALDYIQPDQTVIVDPPRAGCDKKLIEKFLEIKPRTIIYLSCNPATQARDIKMLLDKYIIKSIKTFNFFPKTPHIENLVVLNISPDA